MTWAKSWQTPRPSASTSSARVCTSVALGVVDELAADGGHQRRARALRALPLAGVLGGELRDTPANGA